MTQKPPEKLLKILRSAHVGRTYFNKKFSLEKFNIKHIKIKY